MHALQLKGGGQCPQARWKQQGKHALVRGATGRGDAYYDQASASKIECRNEVRQELGNEHLQSPASAVSEALRRVQEWEDAGLSTVEGADNLAARDLPCGVRLA